MNESDFSQLCRGACIELDIEDVEEAVETGRFEVDDIDMAVFFNEETDPGVLSCYVDLGPVPAEERAAVYENLLHLNAVTGTKTRGVFALDILSGNALLLSHLPAEEMDGPELARILRLYAAQAQTMRAGVLAGPVRMPSSAAQSPLATATLA